MKQEAELIVRPKKRLEAATMKDTLAAMERSGSIHFQKILPKTAMPALANKTRTCLNLPAQFVRENANKIRERVILRVHSSTGKSSRPWIVQLYVIVRSAIATTVQITAGWKHFVAGNGLRMGDSLIFLLKEGVRSEFEVHVFRGPGGSPFFLDLCESSIAADDDDEGTEEKYDYDDDEDKEKRYDYDDDEEENVVSNSIEEENSAHVHHRDSHNRASTRKGRDNKAIPEQQPKHSGNDKAFPGFRKLMTLSNIPQSDGDVLGQFEFPRPFVRTYGEHLQASVQLQGVRQDSPVYVIPCCQCKHADYGHARISLKASKWSKFVKANGLKVGQELQFSLTANLYFKVRLV